MSSTRMTGGHAMMNSAKKKLADGFNATPASLSALKGMKTGEQISPVDSIINPTGDLGGAMSLKDGVLNPMSLGMGTAGVSGTSQPPAVVAMNMLIYDPPQYDFIEFDPPPDTCLNPLQQLVQPQ